MSIPQEVTELINGSGNNFHAKVARWFKSNGWHITVSPYYMDQSQSKAREIDLIAERSWPIRSFGEYRGEIVVRLFVECKFVPSYSVFWFTEKDRSEASNLICSSGIFRHDNTETNKHHYLSHSPKVAKIFASNVQKGQELEPFYKALNQALNAFVSMRRKGVLIPGFRDRAPTHNVLDFPIVICSSFSKMWSVDFISDGPPELIRDNFQLEVRYAYTEPSGHSRDDYFLLDFVEFDKLGEFINVVAQDANIAAYMLSDD